jgi:uncharacterized membrane protein (UPF0127 family)
MMRFFWILPIAILCGSFLSCKETNQNSPEKSNPKQFPIPVGQKTLFLELALDDPTREKGLMHRNHLGKAEGMLFVFENPQPMRFWMKNTRIPLDIGYFGTDGRLKEVHRGQPFDLSGIPSKSQSLQFVIELNAGEFKRLGIKIGDRIDLQKLTEAVLLEGIDPQLFGLPKN